MYLVGICVEPEWKKHTSQQLTAARIALRPRERLKLPRRRGIQVTLRQRRCLSRNVAWHFKYFVRYLYVLGRRRSRPVVGIGKTQG